MKTLGDDVAALVVHLDPDDLLVLTDAPAAGDAEEMIEQAGGQI